MRTPTILLVFGFLLLLAAPSALAVTPQAPSVVTGAASQVTGKSATLSGAVTSNGSRTTYTFQYGTTTSYGFQTRGQDVGPNATNRPVAAHLDRLAPGTAYHYRLVATNGSGTTDGADQTFTTTAAALPVVATGAAGQVTGKSASVSGTLTSNGSRTTYTFQYGTTTAYGLHTRVQDAGPNASNSTVSAQLGRLAPGTAYHYRLVATNDAGTAAGSDGTFTTTAAALPTATTGAASHVSGKSATVSGTLSSNGSRTTYVFQYGTSTAYGSQTRVQDAGPNAVNRTVYAQLGRLASGTAYHYRLVATNSAGTATGNDGTFTTAAVAPKSHKVWFAGSVAGVGTGSLTVNVLWTGPHDGALNGQTLNVSVPANTRIQSGKHHTPIALGSIQVNDLVAIRAATDDDSNFSATGIHVYCNCHWIGGTISSLASNGTSLTVHVNRSGPYDTVLRSHDVTLQVSSTTVYLRGKHDRRLAFGSLRVGDGVGIVFAANGFFKAASFNPSTATFTAKRVHVWNRHQVPEPVSDAQQAAGTSVTG
jgi:hypothetical protein